MPRLLAILMLLGLPTMPVAWAEDAANTTDFDKKIEAFIELLSRHWTDKVTPEVIREQIVAFGDNKEKVIDPMLSRFLDSSNAYQFRAIWALGAINTEQSRAKLLSLAVDEQVRQDDFRYFQRAAAREFAKSVTNKLDAAKLLVSSDPEVRSQAPPAMYGAKLDEPTIQSLVKDMPTASPVTAANIANVFSQDSSGLMTAEKVTAIAEYVDRLATMKDYNKPGWLGHLTNGEEINRRLLTSYSQMPDATAELRSIIPTRRAWRSAVLARAMRKDETAKKETMKIIDDSEAGIWREWAVDALSAIGDEKDLDLLQRVAKQDPLQRQRGGCEPPINKELFFPVRKAAKRAMDAIQKRLANR